MQHTTLAFLAALTMTLSMAGLAAAADPVLCTDTLQPPCQGTICVDSNLNGRHQETECEPRYCTCDPEPQPW